MMLKNLILIFCIGILIIDNFECEDFDSDHFLFEKNKFLSCSSI